MVSKNAVTDRIRQANLRTGKDFLDTLEYIVSHLVDEGIRRASWNKRKTVRAADIAFPVKALGDPSAEPVVTTEVSKPVYEKPRKEVTLGRSSGIFRAGPDRIS